MNRSAIEQKSLEKHSTIIISSSEGVGIARELGAHLSEFTEATIWEDTFDLMTGNLESIIQASSRFDFAVIVLTPDDQVTSRGKEEAAPRDNVLFELGVFMGALGRHRTFVVRYDDDCLKIPSDLEGVTTAKLKQPANNNLRSALNPVATKLRQAMKKAPPRLTGTLSMVDVLTNHLAKSHYGEKIISILKSLPRLANLSVWREDQSEVQRIADLLIQFEELSWGDRAIAVFFGQYTSQPITVYQLFEVIGILGPEKVRFCIENLKNFLSAAAGYPLSFISIRELFTHHIERESATVQELFSRDKLLVLVHKAEEEARQHQQGLRVHQIKYDGPIAKGLSIEDYCSASQMMEEMRSIGIEVIRAGLTFSPSHIVLSCWSPEKQPWMVVTATNTDKSRLLLFAETPLVTKISRSFVYYGDPSKSPSSEALPHWVIHSGLFKAKRDDYRCILHFHSDPLNILADQGHVLLNDGTNIPTVPHIDYGTEVMGKILVESLINQNASAASVQRHGQWFVAPTFSEALRNATSSHESAKQSIRNQGIKTHHQASNAQKG